MKKIYESPVFYAEEYNFSDSIAKCANSVDPNVAKEITWGENVCANSDGHSFCERGTIAINDNISSGSVKLFNDGNGVAPSGCDYDWDYKNNVVYSPSGDPRGTFAVAFYGNNANVKIHAPGYKNAAFFS